jgi:hypothetical protein
VQLGGIMLLKIKKSLRELLSLANNSIISLELYKCAGPSTVGNNLKVKTGIKFTIKKM